MLNFEFSDEQKKLQKKVRDFCRKEITPRVRQIDAQEMIPDEVILGLAKQGLLGMTLAPEHGGFNADAVTLGLVTEEIARADISCAIPTFFLVEACWGYILDRYGSDRARTGILPGVAAGQSFLGIAATEPGAGSDLANIITTAEKEGDRYRVNGAKLHISGVREIMEQLPDGGGYITLVKTDPSAGTRGMSLLYIPVKGTQGVKHSFLEEWGRRGVSAGGLAFKNVEVPAHYLIGEENRGFYTLMQGFDFARAIIAVVCCGVGLSCLEQAMERIKQRTTFGQPIARYQGVQFKLAEHWTRLEAQRLLAYRALWAFDRCQREGDGDPREVTRLCAESKLLAPSIAFEAINDAIQWHGAHGYTVQCPLELALKGVRSYYWAEGALEIQRLIVGRELLGRDFTAKQ